MSCEICKDKSIMEVSVLEQEKETKIKILGWSVGAKEETASYFAARFCPACGRKINEEVEDDSRGEGSAEVH